MTVNFGGRSKGNLIRKRDGNYGTVCYFKNASFTYPETEKAENMGEKNKKII